MGKVEERGILVLNTAKKTFSFQFVNGNEMTGGYISTSIRKVTEENGNVVRVANIYKGRWTNTNEECELEVTNENDGCIFCLRSRRVIDKEHNINTWRKISYFSTFNRCLQSE